MKMQSLILFLILLLVTGCWNYQEVDDFAIVLGLGVDRRDPSGYVLTTESVRIEGGPEVQAEPYLMESMGQSLFDAVRNLALRTGRRLYWAHTAVLVVGKEQADRGLLPIIDWILRDAEMRSNVYVLISEGSAKEVFTTNPEIESFVAFTLSGIMNTHLIVPKFIPKGLWHLKMELTSPGVSAIVYLW